METDTNLPQATEPMGVDLEKANIALQIYPSLSPDAANTLYAMSLKIAANCRAVEQSRAQYIFDNQDGWGYYHLPLVRGMTKENTDIRQSLRDNGIITDAESAIGQFMKLKHRGFEYMYHWCLQLHVEGAEKKREL